MTAKLLGSGRILLDGKQVNLPFKRAGRGTWCTIFLSKGSLTPQNARASSKGDSADEHKVQVELVQRYLLIGAGITGRDFLVGASKNVFSQPEI